MAVRGLRRILAVGFVVWCAQLFREGAGPIVAAPAPDAPAFDSLVVAPAAFSPNGDGKQDSVRISYRLRDSTHVTIRVTTPGGTQWVDSLLSNALQRPGVSHTVAWGGFAAGDTVAVPDGDYEIHLSGNSARGPIPENQRYVRVDTRTAVAVIDSLDPNVYTPTVEGTRSPARVGVRVSDSQPGDSLNVLLRVTGATGRTFRLRLQQNTQVLQGDGFYWAVCDSCTRNRAVPDGSHKVTATTRDAAGNTTTSPAVHLDKNVLGPKPTVTYPSPGTVKYVQRADSLVGTAWDRHGVASVWAWIAGTADSTPDSIPLPGSVRPGDSLYVFRADLASRLAAEDHYRLDLRGADSFGVRDSLRYTIVVDRTPPKAPILSPWPAPVSKSQNLDVRLVFDPADRVYQAAYSSDSTPLDWTAVTNDSSALFVIPLQVGANALSFATRDSALNESPSETLTVVWETSRGLYCPERFHAGDRIQVHMGDVPGAGVEVRVLATDGSMVQRFEDSSSKLVYQFVWDLRTPEGAEVKNGAYLVTALLREAGGRETRIRKLIAVLE